MTDPKPPEPGLYMIEYPYNGSKWLFDIHAESFEEAEERVRAMCFAKLLGKVEMRIPATPAMGWLPRLICWLRNAFPKRA